MVINPRIRLILEPDESLPSIIKPASIPAPMLCTKTNENKVKQNNTKEHRGIQIKTKETKG